MGIGGRGREGKRLRKGLLCCFSDAEVCVWDTSREIVNSVIFSEWLSEVMTEGFSTGFFELFYLLI